MRLNFRAKLVTIVVISALSCALSIATDVIVANRVEHQLTSIRARHLLRVELEPQLKEQFEILRRAFQDAVASRDLDSLAVANDRRSAFVGHLDGARSAVDAGDAAALGAAFEEYFTRATDVSRRLIAGEAGEALVDEMAKMQLQQQRVSKLIEKTAAFDRAELAEAFASVARAHRTATAYAIWITVACLVSVLAILLGLSRSLFRSFAALIEGFARFGEGDFSQTIPIERDEEIANVARHANHMAHHLEAIARERDRAEAALKFSNGELEAFSYSIAHDLRTPLRAINGFSQALVEDCGDRLDAEGKRQLERIAAAARRMGELIDALLSLSQVSRTDLHLQTVDLSAVAEAVIRQLRMTEPERVVDFTAAERVTAHGDPLLLRAVLDNLLGNAWKFTAHTAAAKIVFGVERRGEAVVYCVRDNGAGFDEAYAARLFTPFHRLHRADEFPGTGVGLATAQRIIRRHGGRIWAEGAVGRGASFFFTCSNS